MKKTTKVKDETVRIPAHPGEILKGEFMDPLGITADQLSTAAKIDRYELQYILNENIGVSTTNAFKLGAYFNNTPEFWLNLERARSVAISKNCKELTRTVEWIKANRPQ